MIIGPLLTTRILITAPLRSAGETLQLRSLADRSPPNRDVRITSVYQSISDMVLLRSEGRNGPITDFNG
jgi:hypothetical protein